VNKSETQDRLFFGWKVVWTAFLIAVFAWGVGFYGPSVFLLVLHTTRGWPISLISAAITLHFLFSAVIIAYLPEAHRRFGVWRITFGAVALLGLGGLAWASAWQPWQLFLAALVSGAGWAATSGAAINAIVMPWFEQERPKAISLAFNGASIGGMIFGPLWITLISHYGFLSAALAIAVGMVIVLYPLIVKFLRLTPRDLGLQSDGLSLQPEPQLAITPGKSRAELAKDPRFISLSAAFALALFVQVGLFAHLIARITPEMGETGAAWALSLTTVCAVVGRTLLGWLIGDHNRRVAASANFGIQAVGVSLLTSDAGVVSLLVGCILFGLGVGNLVSLPPLIAQKEYDSRDVGTVVALVIAINQAVFAFAPAIFGAVRDLTGNYAVVFAIAVAIQVGAALLIVTGRRATSST
jgi:MFS family permease